MATSDCNEEQLVMVTKFFRGLSKAKVRPITPEEIPEQSEEDEFLARMNAELLLDIDMRIPVARSTEWLEELKKALHVYISNTERDTPKHHEVIDTLALVKNG
jgi:hypothetical protein